MQIVFCFLPRESLPLTMDCVCARVRQRWGGGERERDKDEDGSRQLTDLCCKADKKAWIKYKQVTARGTDPASRVFG